MGHPPPLPPRPKQPPKSRPPAETWAAVRGGNGKRRGVTKSTTDPPTPSPAHTSFGLHVIRKLISHAKHMITGRPDNHRHVHRQLARPRLACTTGMCLTCERLDDEGRQLYTEGGRVWWGVEVSLRTHKTLTQTIVHVQRLTSTTATRRHTRPC